MKKTRTLFGVLIIILSLSIAVSACKASSPPNPSITLSPPQGFAMTTITGTDFDELKTISITYDNAVQPTIPMVVQTDGNGCFTAMISIPNELAVGIHTITVNDSQGYRASATFTVVNMTGPQGAQGLQGIQGPQGVQGVAGQNGANYNATGNILVYNGTNGINGLNFNATGNLFVYNGTNGSNGVNGLNGLNGRDGTNGINGINGINGKDGTNGTQGAPGVAGQIVYMDPPMIAGVNPYYVATIIIALIALTAAMLAISHKAKKPSQKA